MHQSSKYSKKIKRQDIVILQCFWIIVKHFRNFLEIFSLRTFFLFTGYAIIHMGGRVFIMYAENGMVLRPNDLDLRALTAKESEIEMESLLSDFKPYFAHTAIKYAIRASHEHKDELFNIAQLGFYQAVKGFDRAKGHFFPFAKLVVRNSIIDHIRKKYKKTESTVSLDDDCETEGKPLSKLLGKVSLERYDSDMRQKKIVEELNQFRKELASWKISMESLVKESPKHDALKNSYKEIVQIIMNTPDILDTITKKHYLPIKEISKLSGLPQKKIERARTFILAAILIKIGDYDFLSDYVEGWGKH